MQLAHFVATRLDSPTAPSRAILCRLLELYLRVPTTLPPLSGRPHPRCPAVTGRTGYRRCTIESVFFSGEYPCLESRWVVNYCEPWLWYHSIVLAMPSLRQ